jgi:secreted trypsin-like serine protease
MISLICIFVPKWKKKLIQGDSGGPLVVYEADGQPCQIGIVSFGGDGCESGEPAVFTRITEYLDWLEQTAGVSIRP